MAVAFRSKNTSTSGAGTASSLVVTKPTGVAAGDVLVFAVCVDRASVTWPTGFTDVTGSPAVAVITSEPNTRELWVARKVAGASEPANYTATLSLTEQVAGGIAAYTGVDNTTPVDTSAGTSLVPNGTTITTASITPSVNGCGIVSVFGSDVIDAGGPATWSCPEPTERYDVHDTSTFMTTALYDEIQATAAAITRTGTLTASGGGKMAIILALTPAADAGQILQPDAIATAEQFFAPTIVPGAVILQTAAIATAEQIFAPALVYNQALAPAFITSAEQFFAITLAQTQVLAPGFIVSAEQFFPPTVVGRQVLLPAFIATAEAIFQALIIREVSRRTDPAIAGIGAARFSSGTAGAVTPIPPGTAGAGGQRGVPGTPGEGGGR